MLQCLIDESKDAIREEADKVILSARKMIELKDDNNSSLQKKQEKFKQILAIGTERIKGAVKLIEGEYKFSCTIQYENNLWGFWRSSGTVTESITQTISSKKIKGYKNEDEINQFLRDYVTTLYAEEGKNINMRYPTLHLYPL